MSLLTKEKLSREKSDRMSKEIGKNDKTSNNSQIIDEIAKRKREFINKRRREVRQYVKKKIVERVEKRRRLDDSKNTEKVISEKQKDIINMLRNEK